MRLKFGLIMVALGLLVRPAHAGLFEDCNQSLDADKAIAACTGALTTPTLNNTNRGLVLAHRGNAYFHKADFSRALEDLNEAARLYPTYSKLYNQRGNVLS